MKTFYSYDTRDYRQMIKFQLVTTIVASLVIVFFGITAIISHQKALMSIAVIILCVVIILIAVPARKKNMARIKDETLIAHDWGIEHLVGGETREVKWEFIAKVETINRSFLIYSMKEYVVTVIGDAPIVFYSSLENADFLVNYIKKNLKKREEITLFAKDGGKERPMPGAKYEDVSDE